MAPILSSFVMDALGFISATLAYRLKPLVDSGNLGDAWEALTAAVYLMSSACDPRHASREERIRSFRCGGWDALGKSQSVEDMVESGFYCLNDADHVKCFFCDLGLRDWDVGDVPEHEHAKFSPLCFFLKSSRGLDWLRRTNERPPNFPSSYTRQDHNQLLRTLFDEVNSGAAVIAAKLGFSRTKVLLCLARKYIRFRQKFNVPELLAEMQREWDRELGLSEETELFFDKVDLAEQLDRLIECSINSNMPKYSGSHHTVAATKINNKTPATSAAGSNRCRACRIGEVEIVCLPCGHLSLCAECAKTARTCPAVGCSSRVDNMVRAFVS